MCFNVETNISWNCLISGLLSLEHRSVLLFCFHPIVSVFSEKFYFLATICSQKNKLSDMEQLPPFDDRKYKAIHCLKWDCILRFMFQQLQDYHCFVIIGSTRHVMPESMVLYSFLKTVQLFYLDSIRFSYTIHIWRNIQRMQSMKKNETLWFQFREAKMDIFPFKFSFIIWATSHRNCP